MELPVSLEPAHLQEWKCKHKSTLTARVEPAVCIGYCLWDIILLLLLKEASHAPSPSTCGYTA
jgi:hypothetical protein